VTISFARLQNKEARLPNPPPERRASPAASQVCMRRMCLLVSQFSSCAVVTRTQYAEFVELRRRLRVSMQRSQLLFQESFVLSLSTWCFVFCPAAVACFASPAVAAPIWSLSTKAAVALFMFFWAIILVLERLGRALAAFCTKRHLIASVAIALIVTLSLHGQSFAFMCTFVLVSFSLLLLLQFRKGDAFFTKMVFCGIFGTIAIGSLTLSLPIYEFIGRVLGAISPFLAPGGAAVLALVGTVLLWRLPGHAVRGGGLLLTGVVLGFVVLHFCFLHAATPADACRPIDSKPGAGPLDTVCDLRWHNLSLVDVALFADLSYHRGKEAEQLTKRFGSKHGWEIIPKQSRSNSEQLHFVEFFSKTRNLSVLAIRGTVPLGTANWAQNAALWSTPATITVFRSILPMASFVPDVFVARLLWLLSWFDLVYDVDKYYHDDVHDSLRDESTALKSTKIPGATTIVSAVQIISFNYRGAPVDHGPLSRRRPRCHRRLQLRASHSVCWLLVPGHRPDSLQAQPARRHRRRRVHSGSSERRRGHD
jgi:hypothetical protein